MTFQALMLADLIRHERAAEASPARLERRRVARLVETVARCCETVFAARLRALLPGAAESKTCCTAA